MRRSSAARDAQKLLPFAPVAAAGKRLQVRLFDFAALADRNHVIDFKFKIDCRPAPASPRAVAQQHRRPHGIGKLSLRRMLRRIAALPSPAG